MSIAGSARFGARARRQGAGSGFGVVQAAVGAVVVVALLGVFVWSAVAGQATPAQHPSLFGGSIVLDDERPLVVLDRATGQVTVRLQDVFAQVDAQSYAQVQAVPLADGSTMLVNRTSGAFNLLGSDNYVLKRTGGGVGLGHLAGSTEAVGYADGASAYILRHAPSSTVSLVGSDTVSEAAQYALAKSTRTITPRGFDDLGGSVSSAPGSATVAAGDLWVVVDRNGSRTLRQLVPDPTEGHGLVVRDRGRVGATASALETDAAPGGTEVSVAQVGQVTTYATAGHQPARTVRVPGMTGTTAILPVDGTAGTSWFTFRTGAGWSLVGVDSAGRVVGPHPLTGISAHADLVEPVLSGGDLYTMPTNPHGQPDLWTIVPGTGQVGTVKGAARYPAEKSERATFTDAEVIVTGPRVIFDNPDSELGVVVFTDGSHAPVTIDKNSAVNVSALGPTTVDSATSKTTAPATGQATPAPQAVKASAPQVSQQVTCADTTQTPLAPQVTQATPSANSVLVSWAYPLLDDQDCEPDSWEIAVRALDAPQPASPEEVESGELQYQFGGLRPNTNYQVTVTAFINKQSTPSGPLDFTTTAQGPDAPTSVTTTSDGQGDWIVSWTPCTAADCYVPAATWTVTGSSCGSGFVGSPPTLQVNGSADSVTINAGSLQLLGTSMSFEVQGETASGLPGNPTSDHSCTEAWQPPDPADITLNAAGVPDGNTITAQLAVQTSAAAVDAFGSNATDFTYTVGGQSVTTTATSVSIPGLAPGSSYQPSVAIAPAGHPSASVTVAGTAFSENLPWPDVTATAAFQSGASANLGSVVITFADQPSVPLTAGGTLTCGSFGQDIGGPITNGTLSVPVSLFQLGGDCSISVTLSETSTHDYGVASPAITASVAISGTPPSQSGFSAVLTDDEIVVSGQPAGAGFGWTVSVPALTLSGDDASAYTDSGCQAQAPTPVTSASGPPTFPVTFNLGTTNSDGYTGSQPCSAFYDNAQVDISWTYLGAPSNVTVTVTGDGGTIPTTTTTTTVPPATSTPPTTTTTPTTKATSSTSKQAAASSGDPSGPTVLASASRPMAAPGAENQDSRTELDVTFAVLVAALAATGLGLRRRSRTAPSRSTRSTTK